VIAVRGIVFFICLGAILPAAEPQPETAAAFDRYVKLTEEGFAQHEGLQDFLWLDHHPNDKTMVWMQQSVLVPMQTLDHGAPIEVPGGVIQHWLGAFYAEGADAGGSGRVMLNFAQYKDYFKPEIIDSKVKKRDGEQYDLLLRLYKKQISTVVLNVDGIARSKALDSKRWTLNFHSTHIGEVEHPKDKKKLDQERSPEETEGYLWRLNLYFRFEQRDNGVYIEFEVLSLARDFEGKLNRSKLLTGFQDFPHEFAQDMLAALEKMFPRPPRV
jgi:hypothetical protein